MSLKLVTNSMVESLETLYAIRSDDNLLPVVEIVKTYRSTDKWGAVILVALEPLKYENKLYPYDSFKYHGHVKTQSVSDCYSKGYIFHTMSDAVRRIELLLEKKEVKMEKVVSEYASWKARLDILKGCRQEKGNIA